MIVFLQGLLSGIATLLPVGALTLFIINQGVIAGFPRVLIAVIAVSFFDSGLIVLGALGPTKLFAILGLQEDVLLLIGAMVLIVLGLRALRMSQQDQQHDDGVKPRRSIAATIAASASISLLNPVALLETVGYLGGQIAAFPAGEQRVLFTLGVLFASWLWFSVFGIFASYFRRYLTPRILIWVHRAGGLLMLGFAAKIVREMIW